MNPHPQANVDQKTKYNDEYREHYQPWINTLERAFNPFSHTNSSSVPSFPISNGAVSSDYHLTSLRPAFLMSSPPFHQPFYFSTLAQTKCGVRLEYALLLRARQTSNVSIDQPGNLQFHGGVDKPVELSRGMLQGEGIGVG